MIWMRWVGLGLGGLMMVTGLTIVTDGILATFTPWVPPQPLTARQLTEAPAYVTIPPMTIALRFVDPKAFYADQAPGFTGQSQYGKGVRGCTILIPSGGIIEAWPQQGFAAFVHANDAPNLAHEILHCISGLWHPGWPTILASGASVTEYYEVHAPRGVATFQERPDPRSLQ